MSQTTLEAGREQGIAGPSLNRLQRLSVVMALVGLVAALAGAFLDREQFWQSYLLAYSFWLHIALGCLGVVMLHHLVGGRWSAMIRRLMEAGAMTLPLMAVLFIPLLFGLTTLYPWTDSAHVAESELLQHKAAYLNIPFFVLRAALYFMVWLGLAFLLRRWSLEQDRTGEPGPARRMRRLSAVGMILYVLAVTFAAYDWLMSLEPEWFSSIYGLLLLAGQGAAALAVAVIGLRAMDHTQALSQERIQAFNHLGNLLLGFVMLWAYLAFSQFLIIWSANIPEEAIWYYHRSQGGWLGVGMVLIGVHFAVPMLLLFSRRVKRRGTVLALLAALLLAARLVDLVWLVVPAFYPDALHLHWLDPVLVIAMGGGWLAFFIRQWVSKAPLPRHDPHLESLVDSHLPTAASQV